MQCSNLSSNAVLTFVLKKHCAMPLYCTKMFAILKMFENAFYVFDIFALNYCPLTALHASGPKMLWKNHLKKYQSLWKCPSSAIFYQWFELKSDPKSKTLFQLKIFFHISYLAIEIYFFYLFFNSNAFI